MLQRGSAQLLLLFFRPRHRLGRTLGAIAGVIFAAGLLLSAIGVSSLAPGELVHVLRQSAWDRAFTGSPDHAPWPWVATSNVTAAKVPRLGLSAAVMQEAAEKAKPRLIVDQPRREPEAVLSTMAIGDRITVTTGNGASHVYRVTGRRIVDPHLAETDSRVLDGDAALATCEPHDAASTLQLVIQVIANQAITNELPAEPKDERKL